MKIESIGVLTIATRNYIHYWKELALSIDKHDISNLRITLHVFTDDVLVCEDYAAKLKNISLQVHPIESYGWPEASLLRYEIYSRHRSVLSEDLLMHLDADMLVVNDVDFECSPTEWENGMAFVLHPGFYRVTLRVLHFMKTGRFYACAKLIYNYVLMGGFGAWETEPTSVAYVSRERRNIYCCGGVWLGHNVAFLEFCAELSRQVNLDLKNGVMARWHDESHLNHFVSNIEKVTIFSPSYCYDRRYDVDGKLKRKIIAIDKRVGKI